MCLSSNKISQKFRLGRNETSQRSGRYSVQAQVIMWQKDLAARCDVNFMSISSLICPKYVIYRRATDENFPQTFQRNMQCRQRLTKIGKNSQISHICLLEY